MITGDAEPLPLPDLATALARLYQAWQARYTYEPQGASVVRLDKTTGEVARLQQTATGFIWHVEERASA
jgi:hypothetical protein